MGTSGFHEARASQHKQKSVIDFLECSFCSPWCRKLPELSKPKKKKKYSSVSILQHAVIDANYGGKLQQHRNSGL